MGLIKKTKEVIHNTARTVSPTYRLLHHRYTKYKQKKAKKARLERKRGNG